MIGTMFFYISILTNEESMCVIPRNTEIWELQKWKDVFQ